MLKTQFVDIKGIPVVKHGFCIELTIKALVWVEAINVSEAETIAWHLDKKLIDTESEEELLIVDVEVSK